MKPYHEEHTMVLRCDRATMNIPEVNLKPSRAERRRLARERRQRWK